MRRKLNTFVKETIHTLTVKKIKRERQDHFKDLVLHGAYVDKTKFIEKLEKVNIEKQSIACFRPSGFGKTVTFLMLKNYYDVKTVDEKTFQNLYIGHNPTKRAHQHLILELSFSGIDRSSIEKFDMSFNNSMNNSMRDFRENYKEELDGHSFEINDDDCVNTYDKLVMSVLSAGESLYLLVDSYDSFVNEALGSIGLHKVLQDEVQQTMKKIETKFIQFMTTVKDSEKEGVYVFLTGVIPLDVPGFDSVRDISFDREFSEMCGFTEAEVKAQLNFIPQELNIVDDVATMLKEKHNGYRFAQVDDSFGVVNHISSMYNPERIRSYIYDLSERLKLLANTFGLEKLKRAEKSRLLEDLFHFPEVRDITRAECILPLLVNNPLFLNTVRELLEKGGIQCHLQFRFKLSSIVEDIFDEPNSLLSLFYFLGELTHSNETRGYLVIPNGTTKKEFLEQCFKLIS